MFALQGDMLCSGPDTHWSLCFESLTVLVKITADDHCAEARAVLSTELTGGGRGRALGVRSDWGLVSTLTAPHSVEPLTELQHSSDNHQASRPGRAGDGDTGDRERGTSQASRAAPRAVSLGIKCGTFSVGRVRGPATVTAAWSGQWCRRGRETLTRSDTRVTTRPPASLSLSPGPGG